MDDQEQELLRGQYRSWVSSPVGQDLLHYLNEQYEISVDNAVDSNDLQRKALELQNASAYKTIRSYIERMSST